MNKRRIAKLKRKLKQNHARQVRLKAVITREALNECRKVEQSVALIGETLKSLRLMCGMSQKTVARGLKQHQSAVSYTENKALHSGIRKVAKMLAFYGKGPLEL